MSRAVVVTSAGAVEVVAPQVNDKRTDPYTGQRRRFSSVILPPWARQTPKVTEVLPLLYLHGGPPTEEVHSFSSLRSPSIWIQPDAARAHRAADQQPRDTAPSGAPQPTGQT